MNHTESPWSISADEIINASGGNLEGLTNALAGERLLQAGPNKLETKDREPWYMLFLMQFANPLVYILLIAACIKAYFKGPIDAAVIGGVLLFMAVIGFIQEMKARKAMEALLNLSAPKAKIRRDGKPVFIDAAEVVPGDVLLLDAGDRVAADARLIESANLRINESPFTGESMPVDKDIRVVEKDAPIHDRKNMIFMGTTVSHGRALAVVTATGMNTEIGKIAAAIQGTKKDKTPLQKSVDRLGHSLIWVVLIACFILAIAGLLHGMALVDVILLAVAAAVSGIPEGLPAAVTVVLAICVNRMAKRNVIIRKLTAVETLGTATIICSDKTGTLTLNQMTVREIWTSGRLYSVSGSGYEPQGSFLQNGIHVTIDKDPTIERLLRIVTLCNDALLSKNDTEWGILGDPTEGALLAAAAKAGIYKSKLEKLQPRLDEISFDSEKQFMATLHAENGQRTAYVKGSPEKVLAMCSDYQSVNGPAALDESIRSHIMDANSAMATKALRVLAVAAIPYPVEFGKLDAANLSGRLIFIGLTGMIDPPREEARKAIQACKTAGVRVAMITGDNPVTAAAIAAQLDICKPGEEAVTGKEIEEMDDKRLLDTCRTHSVYARIAPLHKLRIVNMYKKDGHITAMTGDGVNDAPALEAASIGIAMGITGTDVAKEAADVVLADDNFASIVSAVEEGRIVFNRLRNATFFLLMTCFSELLTLFLSVAFYGESPLIPIQILWINLVTGALVAIPLGLEPGIGNELKQPPREAGVGLLYKGMMLRIGFVALCMSVLVSWLFHHAPLPIESDVLTTHEIRQTIAFTAIVVFEWLFAFQARSPEKGVLQIGLFANPWLVASMTLGLGLQMLVVYLPAANKVFHTHPLSAPELLWTLIPGVVAVTIETFRKRFAPGMFGQGQWRLYKHGKSREKPNE